MALSFRSPSTRRVWSLSAVLASAALVACGGGRPGGRCDPGHPPGSSYHCPTVTVVVDGDDASQYCVVCSGPTLYHVVLWKVGAWPHSADVQLVTRSERGGRERLMVPEPMARRTTVHHGDVVIVEHH